MDKGQKGHSEFIIAGSDPAKNFELIEKTLDQVALLVGVKIAEIILLRIRINKRKK